MAEESVAVMTVGALISKLEGVDPDLLVIVDCEKDGDPHPVIGALVVHGDVEGDQRWVGHVIIHQDKRTDFKRIEWLRKVDAAPDDPLRCAACGRPFVDPSDALEMQDGRMVHAYCDAPLET